MVVGSGTVDGLATLAITVFIAVIVATLVASGVLTFFAFSLKKYSLITPAAILVLFLISFVTRMLFTFYHGQAKYPILAFGIMMSVALLVYVALTMMFLEFASMNPGTIAGNPVYMAVQPVARALIWFVCVSVLFHAVPTIGNFTTKFLL